MIKRLAMFFVISAFLFLLTYIPFSHLFAYFSSGFAVYAWFATLVSVLFFPVGFLIASLKQNKFTYYILKFTNGWFAALLIIIFSTLFVEFIQLVTYFTPIHMPWYVLGLSVLLIIIAFISGRVWKVRKITIITDKIKKPVTFVQLSDIHAYGVYASKNLKKVYERALQLNPDFIVATGDIVDVPIKPPLDTFQILNDIKIPLFYSLGNHESYVGLDYIRKMLKGSKLQLLENSSKLVDGISLVAINDSKDKQYVDKILPTIKRNKSKFQVLLHHKPRGYISAQKEGINLMLSGHTHAGQFFPLQAIVRLQYKYPWGTHNINGMLLHTSSGSGTFTWPLRLGSVNELTLIKLLPK